MTYPQRLVSYLAVLFFLSGILLFIPSNKQQNIPVDNNVVAVKQSAPEDSKVLGTLASTHWYQTSFTGGVDNGPFTIPWGSTGGWSNYSSQNNMTIDSSGIRSSDGNAAELVSSIFDQGNYRSHPVASSNDTAYSNLQSVRGGDTPEAVLNASWKTGYMQCPLPNKYIQYKITLPIEYQPNAAVQKVTFTSGVLSVAGVFYNTSGKQIGGNVEINGSSVEVTSTTKPAYSLPINFVVGGSLIVKASSPGYVSQTKTVSMSLDENGCPATTYVDFKLAVISNNSNSTPPPAPPAEVVIPIKKTTLPTSFTQAGSSTTDLTKLTDPAKVPNLTLDIPNKNAIVFAEDVDLSTQAAADVFSKLDTYVKVDKLGVVEIDSKIAPFLNKKAKIIMRNLTFKNTPQVLVDGKADSNVVTNISYINGTLSFDVAHFTKFEAVAYTSKVAISKEETQRPTLIIIGLLLTSFILSSYLVYSLKKSGKIFKSKTI